MEKMQILVAMNNLSDAGMIKKYLEKEWGKNAEVLITTSLQSSVSRISEAEFDIFLFESSLPDNRLETIRKITISSPDTALIMITAANKSQNSKNNADRYLNCGVQDIIEKQVLSPSLVVKSICYAITKKAIWREREEHFQDLADALSRIESLEELLPLCACCKKVWNGRDWTTINEHRHNTTYENESKPQLCPDCQMMKMQSGSALIN